MNEERVAVAIPAVLAQQLAVIGGYDHEGVVGLSARFQVIEDPTELLIHVTDLGVVERHGAGLLSLAHEQIAEFVGGRVRRVRIEVGQEQEERRVYRRIGRRVYRRIGRRVCRRVEERDRPLGDLRAVSTGAASDVLVVVEIESPVESEDAHHPRPGNDGAGPVARGAQ